LAFGSGIGEGDFGAVEAPVLHVLACFSKMIAKPNERLLIY
jgi:hypothetical protein